MKNYHILLLFIIFMLSPSFGGSTSRTKLNYLKVQVTENKQKNYIQFRAGYGKNFNDTSELHLESTQSIGIKSLKSYSDTLKYIVEGKLMRLPMELEVFKVDNLTYSVPYLVPQASALLLDTGINFRDSLISKKLPFYKPIVTSITRSEDDVKKLAHFNVNASSLSVHQFGMTFDISWVNFQKVDSTDTRNLNTSSLKLILAQVLYDLRQQDRCYIKYERIQPCFHITAR